MLKGLNLTSQWKYKVVHIFSDLVCVYHWLLWLANLEYVNMMKVDEKTDDWQLQFGWWHHLDCVRTESSRWSNLGTKKVAWHDQMRDQPIVAHVCYFNGPTNTWAYPGHTPKWICWHLACSLLCLRSMPLDYESSCQVGNTRLQIVSDGKPNTSSMAKGETWSG